MAKHKLFIIEGFDRTGKDYTLSYIEDLYKDKNLCIYKQNNTPPPYRNCPEEFGIWLTKFLKQQAKDLVSIGNNILMARLFTSEHVYSNIFRQGNNVISQELESYLTDNFDIYQYIILFKDYQNYLTRCKQLNEPEIEYSEDEFTKICDLYTNSPYNKKFNTMIFRISASFDNNVANSILTNIQEVLC